jgi:hypothetical protein
MTKKKKKYKLFRNSKTIECDLVFNFLNQLFYYNYINYV